jgi:hypothetical protein
MLRRRRGLLAGIALAGAVLALAACAPAADPSGDTGCPPTLAAAMESRSRISGAPVAQVAAVTPAELPLPVTRTLLARACILRLHYSVLLSLPTVFRVLVPGGAGVQSALGAALARDGWLPTGDPGLLRSMSSGRATLETTTAARWARTLPPGAAVPPGSAYASGSIVLLGVFLQARPAGF